MPDLSARLRNAVDTAAPIDISEISSAGRTLPPRPSRRPRILVASVVLATALALLVAAWAGVFTSTTTNRVEVGAGPQAISSSATRDGVTVTVTLSRRAYRTGQTIHGHLTFDNQTGHPYRNGDACPDEGMNVFLDGPGVSYPLPSDVGCTHPYLLPSGSTTVPFSVNTTRSGPGSPAVSPGAYRVEVILYPGGLPTPPGLHIYLTHASTAATARLTLQTPTVTSGEVVKGTLIVTTPRPIRGCPDNWYVIGLSSPRTGLQAPLWSLSDCGTATAIPAGTSTYHFKEPATFQGCVNVASEATSDRPRCTGRSLPPLPPGRYRVNVKLYLAGIPTPATESLTVKSR